MKFFNSPAGGSLIDGIGGALRAYGENQQQHQGQQQSHAQSLARLMQLAHKRDRDQSLNVAQTSLDACARRSETRPVGRSESDPPKGGSFYALLI
jgi:hypothetical protein